jgi:hypothetical protein
MSPIEIVVGCPGNAWIVQSSVVLVMALMGIQPPSNGMPAGGVNVNSLATVDGTPGALAVLPGSDPAVSVDDWRLLGAVLDLSVQPCTAIKPAASIGATQRRADARGRGLLGTNECVFTGPPSQKRHQQTEESPQW